MRKRRMLMVLLAVSWLIGSAWAIDNKGITFEQPAADCFTLIEGGKATPILLDEKDDVGIVIAAKNLQDDFRKVTGRQAELLHSVRGPRLIVAGSLESRFIKELVKAKKIDITSLKGKREKYLMKAVSRPFDGVDEAWVVIGSDKRGTIYGIYELSEQIGVSPWYDWADVPVVQRKDLYIRRGEYTAGESAVKYRGIFLNDEAPCLTGWVKHTYGTNYGDHRFYARVFELILRLRGNFMWPAMWAWSFLCG